ncbi:apolipoprotein N-acyltransferase [Arsenicicoccus sp. MKL-02]|uniref:Apolipoprotein N-acyltransferase n=1 Tax=Arsenicicoccus cauae TaxID=2663847 RepID=A0A6I3ICQ9_9MICO|nr:apolipoprotein N-acyltransferase [Arsenicicoccus cauae]MTB71507.1 apolipoprotein N-acyltransferase [Arsenicicoccus cauae]
MRRLLLALPLAIGAGLALWLSWPDHDLWWLAPLGIGLLAVAAHGAGVRRGFLLGLVTGLAAYLPALHWSGIYVGDLPWVALSVLQALYVGITGALCGLLSPTRTSPRGGRLPGPLPARLPYPVVVAAAWTVGEWLRATTPFGGFPWIKVAFAMADAPILPLVRYVGTPGLTAAVALVGGLLAVAVRHAAGARSARRSRPTALRHTALSLGSLLGAAALLWGPALLPVPTDGRTVDVLAVQGNVPRAGLDFNAERRQVLDNHVGVTVEAVRSRAASGVPRPDLVVWPENASDIDPVRNADAGQAITYAARTAQAPVLVGTLRTDDQARIKNTTLLWDAQHGPVAAYAKRHPVPFAEYIPYRSFFRHFSDKVDLLTHDFTAGDTVGVMDVPTRAGSVRVGLGICFEVAYDDLMRDAVHHGGQLLAVQTNNATFGYTDESYQQLAISRVRAVELGRSVVHVSTVGASAMITPDGVAHDRTGLFTAAALDAALPLRSELTPAARIGDLPVWVGVGLLALGLALRPRRGRRGRRGRWGRRQRPTRGSGTRLTEPSDPTDG